MFASLNFWEWVMIVLTHILIFGSGLIAGFFVALFYD